MADAAPSGLPASVAGPLERLHRLHPKVIDLSLERISSLLDALDHPEQRLKNVVHVAGTNGKGSLIAIMDACLTAAGETVHVYTSPHLVRFNERIRIAGSLISDDALLTLINRCEAVNAGRPVTFFEITTAIAFMAFAETPADVTLLETGLGGRLDATNVIAKPALSVVTPVDMDHQGFLGETLATIAGEKAGILKSGVSAVIARQPPDAMAVIDEAARRVGAPLFVRDRHWQAHQQDGRLIYQDEGGSLTLPLPALSGAHQIDNAALAVAALRQLTRDGLELPRRVLKQGLHGVQWPARLQRLRCGALADAAGNGELWLDGGHNPAAGRALAAAMADLARHDPRPLTLVVAMMGNKDAHGFLSAFADLSPRIVAVGLPGEENAFQPQELARIARRTDPDARTAEGVREAVAAAPDGSRILVCGSLYLAGQVLGVSQDTS